MREPTLRELQGHDRQLRAEGYRPGLLADARRLGIEVADDIDIWKLMDAVHGEQDRLRWPGLVKQAEALGMRPRKYRRRSDATRLALDIYAEQDRQRLLKQYPEVGRELSEPAEGRRHREAGYLAKAWRAVVLRLFGH